MQGWSMLIDPVKGPGGVKELSHPPFLEHLQKEVGGGSIESVPMFRDMEYKGERYHAVALCNEHGKMRDMPANPYAQGLWHATLSRNGFGPINDMLVGPVVVLWGDDAFMQEL